MEGEAKFYGPSLDILIKDALGREWQCTTIQVDFNLPSRFNIEYDGKDGKKHTPIILHRVIYGSLERFIGVLMEHYAGKLPLWLNPSQVKILTIADRFNKYAEEVITEIEKRGLRVEKDFRSESINKKIRDAQVEKVNYILVIGEKEVKDKTVNIRTRDGKVIGERKIEDFIKKAKEETDKKMLTTIY